VTERTWESLLLTVTSIQEVRKAFAPSSQIFSTKRIGRDFTDILQSSETIWHITKQVCSLGHVGIEILAVEIIIAPKNKLCSYISGECAHDKREADFASWLSKISKLRSQNGDDREKGSQFFKNKEAQRVRKSL
jgi:hypothetical protein